MSDSFDDARKLRQELGDLWPRLRKAEDDNVTLRRELAEARVLVRHMRDVLDPRRAPGSLYGRADDFLKKLEAPK